jgi:hypothetical protein
MLIYIHTYIHMYIHTYGSYNLSYRIKEMTAEECQQCKMAISDYNFTTVPKFLAWFLYINHLLLSVSTNAFLLIEYCTYIYIHIHT